MACLLCDNCMHFLSALVKTNKQKKSTQNPDNANSYQINPTPSPIFLYKFKIHLRFISALAGSVTFLKEIWHAVPGYSEQERPLHITNQSDLSVILTLLLESNPIL